MGVTLLFAIHRDPVELVVQIARAIHLPLTSRLFDRVVGLALHVTPRQEFGLALTAFGYAIVMATEGVGLHLRRRWARWFTIGVTASFIPVEIYEIVREPRALRITVLLVNAAILWYLWRRGDEFE